MILSITKMQEKVTLRALAPPSLRPAAAAMPRYAAESVVPLSRAPSSAPSTQTQASFIAGYPQDRAWDPDACRAYRHETHAGRVLPNPPLSQWPPAASSRGTPSSPAAVAVCDLHPTQH